MNISNRIIGKVMFVVLLVLIWAMIIGMMISDSGGGLSPTPTLVPEETLIATVTRTPKITPKNTSTPGEISDVPTTAVVTRDPYPGPGTPVPYP